MGEGTNRQTGDRQTDRVALIVEQILALQGLLNIIIG